LAQSLEVIDDDDDDDDLHYFMVKEVWLCWFVLPYPNLCNLYSVDQLVGG
jgi:hypothetical protein